MDKEEVFADLRVGFNKAKDAAGQATQSALPFVVRGANAVSDFAQSFIRDKEVDMSQVLNLVKGQTLNLTKATGGLTKFVINLAWKSGSDLDVSVIPLNAIGDKMEMPIVFYGNLKAEGISHSGDLRDGGEEEITVDTEVLKGTKYLVAITSHSQKADSTGKQVPGEPILFGVADQPIATLLDDKGNALVTSKLNEDAALTTAIEFVLLEKKADGDWMYTSVVNPLGRSAFGLQELVNKYPQA